MNMLKLEKYKIRKKKITFKRIMNHDIIGVILVSLCDLLWIFFLYCIFTNTFIGKR